MSHSGSNIDIRPAGRNAPVVAIGAAGAIIAVLIGSGAVWLSHGGGSGTDLAVVTSSTPSCPTGSLLVIGSSAFRPIAQDAADAYEQTCRGASTISVNSVKDQETANAYNQACSHVTITVNSVKSADSAYGLTQVQNEVTYHCKDADSMIAMYDGPYSGDTPGLVAHPMGVLILSVIAQRGGHFGSDIPVDELRRIFLHGEQGVIAVGRREGSGSRKAFLTNILQANPDPQLYEDNCPPPAGVTSCTEDSTANAIGFVNTTPNAIGYAAYNESSSSDLQVQALTIAGVPPTADMVAAERYNFLAVEHLYAPTRPSMLTTDFLDFLPRYLDSSPEYTAPHTSSDIIACSYAPRTEALCYPASPPPPSPTPSNTPSAAAGGDSVNKRLVVSIATMGIAAIVVIVIIDYLRRRRRAEENP
jgi:ABC-type phosphate transport system substrate-binding protein